MHRQITGFHFDEEQRRVAEPGCGHDRHVRHEPPWASRSRVVTEAGRARMLGTVLDCRLCDSAASPASTRNPETDTNPQGNGRTRSMTALQEVTHTRQVPGESPRRWFTSDDMDLVVWYGGPGHITAFQLCYDKGRAERAITWREHHPGLEHRGVDDGESRELNHKMSPVLVPDGELRAGDVLADFRAASTALPAEIVALVSERLADEIGGGRR